MHNAIYINSRLFGNHVRFNANKANICCLQALTLCDVIAVTNRGDIRCHILTFLSYSLNLVVNNNNDDNNTNISVL
jgi:hypothetical protein